MKIPYLTDNENFPNPENANEDGIVAIGGDLSLTRLVNAYSSGIFPWFDNESPILWWSPNPRFVLFLNNFIVSQSLRQVIHSKKFEVKIDTNFEQVIVNCAFTKRNHETGTWITNDMINAYISLYNNGIAHSFETYKNGELVGGLYGVSIGKAFFGESMFYRESNASKVAMCTLVELMKKWNFYFIDSQVYTDNLARFGASEISRNEYLKLLKKALGFETKVGRWKIE